jgi:hypothetical protein
VRWRTNSGDGPEARFVPVGDRSRWAPGAGPGPTRPHTGSASSTPPWPAWPGTAPSRRPWTTSPVRPGCRGPPSTGCSPGAVTRCWPPWSTPRWPGSSRPSASDWERPTDLAEALVGGIVEAIHPDPWPCRPGLPGGARARDGARPPGLRRVGPAAVDRVPVHRAVPGPLDEPAEAERVAEWATRIVLSYAIAPSTDHGPDRSGPTPPTWSRPSCSPGSAPCTGRSEVTAAIDITPFTPNSNTPDTVQSTRPSRAATSEPAHHHAEGRQAMTTEMSSTEEIIGRAEIDDFEAILSVVGTEEADGRHVVHSDYDSIFTWDYEKGARPKLNKLYEKAKGAQWNGETDLPWEIEVDQEKLVREQAEATGGFGAGFDLTGTPVGEVGRQGVGGLRGGEPELDAVPVPPRRAGRPHLHGQDRGVGAVDRRQVLRLHPGDGRGPPRGGLRQVPRREAVRPLSGQRPSAHAARRHHRRLAVGHDLPGHADHGGGPGPGRLRVHASDDRGPAAQAAAALRDGRRGPPRGLRCPQPRRSTTRG